MSKKLIILLIQFINLINLNCQICNKDNPIENNKCLNEIKIFKFEDKHYRAGHFATNTNGDMIIEYSFEPFRLFYGLKKDGREYYPDGIKEIKILNDTIFSERLGRYESINSFVSIINDIKKEKEYLLSISSYKTILELYDIENGDYKIKDSVDFFNKDNGIFSYIFQILETKIYDKIIYFCVYIYGTKIMAPSHGGLTEQGNNFVIKRFGFSSFDFNNLEEEKEIVNSNYNNRITSSLILDKYNILLVFSVQQGNKDSYIYYLYLYFYNYNLEKLNDFQIETLTPYDSGRGVFFKSISLNDNYIAILYFIDDNEYKLKILIAEENNNKINFNMHLLFSDNRLNLNPDITLNDFIKLDNERLAFISTDNNKILSKLYIIFFDLYKNYTFIKIRYYSIDFSDMNSIFAKELSVHLYNGFLAFTSTMSIDENNGIYSIFMVFGYANGTDFEMDISSYFIDSDVYSSSKNFIIDLMDKLIIDNNIFSYEKVQKIKLITIPEEILFYYSINNSLVLNNSIIDIDYILKQNSNLVKDDRYYFLDFQFIVQEPDFDIFYQNNKNLKVSDSSPEQTINPNDFNPRIFFGRINTIKFKLCSQNCKTCRKFGSNDFGQECESCTIEELIFNSCNILNYTNEQISNKITNDLIPEYNTKNGGIEIKGEGNSMFHLTTTSNELNALSDVSEYSLKSNRLSIVDISKCEPLLKQKNNIDSNISLILKKFEILSKSSERNVQYEVYNPINKKKLDLSICKDDMIDIYIPIEINDDLIELYNDLQKNGYDLFNIKDPFYNDFCTRYKTKNGTDVLLADRKNDIYNNNYTTCQSNCEYSSFNPEYKFLKCECKVIADDIDFNDIHKFSQRIYKNFYEIIENSNYKVLKCYKLVFNMEYLKANIGNFIVFAFFLIYLIFFIIYLIKGITPLNDEVKKYIDNKPKNIIPIENNKIKKNNKKVNFKNINSNFPNKNKRSKMTKNKKYITDNNNLKKSKISKSITSEKNSEKSYKSSNKLNNNKELRLNKIDKENNEKDKKIFKENNNKEICDDLNLNNLEYEKAIVLDKRTFGQIYLSKIKNKQLIIFTFASNHDYNLIYIKIPRFIFLICTSMAMNVFFFFDISMHKIYIDYGKYNFIQQLPQIIYSSLISSLIEMLISFLSYTDKNIYEIRKMKKITDEKIKNNLNNIKIKLSIFFIITFLFFLFYWYLISAFCAVYFNTQIIYVKDFTSSFCIGLLYPFIIQIFLSFLRRISLKEKSTVRKILYKLS